MVSLKDVKDECSKCGDLFICVLCREGHGIRQRHTNVAKMVECQFNHKEKREKETNERVIRITSSGN